MRSSLTLTTLTAILTSSEFCLADISSLRQNIEDDPRFLKSITEDCTLGIISDARSLEEEHHVHSDDGDDIICSMGSSSYPIQFDSPEQKDEMMNMLIHDGGINSDNEFILKKEDTINIAVSTSGHEADKILLPPGLDSYSIEKKPKNQRRLVVSGTDERSLLVVRVIDVDGKVNPDNSTVMSDKIFGTYGDPVTMKSQMKDCSFEKVILTNTYTVDISAHLKAPGVIEVNSTRSLAVDDRYVVHNDVTVQIETMMGLDLSTTFDHVLYVMEGCYVECGYAAYAYVNSWMSVFQGGYYKYAALGLHELGHNIGLAHSGGLDGLTYTDHTCVMGNPLYSDDIGKMCFNPAKNWQLGWYDDREILVDIQPDFVDYEGILVGVADYGNNPQDRKVVIKLETGTEEDYFIGFNRATGINIDNVEADDEVTVVRVSGGNGESYAQSYLEAHLIEGESVVVGGATITAVKIDTSTSPGTAEISISKVTTSAPSLSPVLNFPNLALQGTASQTTTCQNGHASRAIDGNISGVWNGGSVTHTCSATSNNNWKVTLPYFARIRRIVIWNRTDCCQYRLNNAVLKILGEGSVISEQVITTNALAHGQQSFTFDFENIYGKKVKVIKDDVISLAEVQIFGEFVSSPSVEPTQVPSKNPTSIPSSSPSLGSPIGSPVSPPITADQCKTLCCNPIDENGNGGWANEYMRTSCENSGCHYVMSENGSSYCSGSNYESCVQNNCSSPPPCVDADTYAHRKQRDRACSWLEGQSQDKIDKMCQFKTKFFRYDEEWFDPAHIACKSVCNSCDSCAEVDRARFYFDTNDIGQHIIKSCNWLKNQNPTTQQNVCEQTAVLEPYPRAYDACPQTCNNSACL